MCICVFIVINKMSLPNPSSQCILLQNSKSVHYTGDFFPNRLNNNEVRLNIKYEYSDYMSGVLCTHIVHTCLFNVCVSECVCLYMGVRVCVCVFYLNNIIQCPSV